jgi:hypothetical protein
VPGIVAAVEQSGRVALLGRHEVAFAPAQDMRFLQRERQAYHSNAMALAAWDASGEMLTRRLFYSVGGGFVLDEDEVIRNAPGLDLPAPPYPFASAGELIEIGERTGLSIAQIMLANELAWRSPSEVDPGSICWPIPWLPASIAAAPRAALCPAGSRCAAAPPRWRRNCSTASRCRCRSRSPCSTGSTCGPWR